MLWSRISSNHAYDEHEVHMFKWFQPKVVVLLCIVQSQAKVCCLVPISVRVDLMEMPPHQLSTVNHYTFQPIWEFHTWAWLAALHYGSSTLEPDWLHCIMGVLYLSLIGCTALWEFHSKAWLAALYYGSSILEPDWLHCIMEVTYLSLIGCTA